jgi:hypothetical protein
VDKGRRTVNGQIYDTIDYTFEVARGDTHCMVNVGIWGGWHDEILSLKRKLSRAELIAASIRFVCEMDQDQKSRIVR